MKRHFLTFALTIALIETAFVVRAADAPATAPSKAPSTASAPASAWAFHGGGPMLGHAPELGPPPMKLRWTYRADEDGDAGIAGGAAIDRGRVYVADAKGVLHAIDLATGARRWTYPGGGAEGFATTPLILGDRVLIGDLAGVVHAVSSDKGEKLWTRETGSPINASANAATPGATRLVVANDGGKVLCLDASSGDVLWTAQGGDRINGAPTIVADMVYVVGCDARLMVLNLADGTERFNADIGALGGGSAAVLGDRVVIGTDEGRVTCLARDDGKPLWTYEQIANKAMAYASPAVSGNVVVIGARDRQVHAVDLTNGKPLWTFRARLDVDSSPLISGGRVYVGSKDKSLYVLDLASGKPLWDFKASRAILASPAIADGVIVISDDAGNVYCLEATGTRHQSRT